MNRSFLSALFLAVLVACKEAKSPAGPDYLGPDLVGPDLFVTPGADTTVDSVGTLPIVVTAWDPSAIKSLRLDLFGINAAFLPLVPNDTLYTAVFPIALGSFRRTSFRFVVRASDVLDHETVTDTVTVTVP